MALATGVGTGMAMMLVGFVNHSQNLWRKRRSELGLHHFSYWPQIWLHFYKVPGCEIISILA